MKTHLVKNLMVPLSEYVTVSQEATLQEAILALEKAHKDFDPTQHRHRGILIYDENNKIVGKIGQIDILRALEPKYDKIMSSDAFARMGLSPVYQKTLVEQYMLWNKPMNDICRKAAELKVRSFMQAPMEGEYIDEEASLDTAIHQLIMGKHLSLLVTRDKNIIGILRLIDVFMEIADNVKACKL
jgi:CBS domain-containing protein